MDYLATAAQDAVIGSLLKKGQAATALPQTLEPERLQVSQVKRAGTDSVLAGRINVVGDTYRVFLKWVRADGRSSQEYLEVAGLNQLLPQLEEFARSKLEAPPPVAAAPAPPKADQPPPHVAAPVPPPRPEPPVVSAPPPVPEPKKPSKTEVRKEEKERKKILAESAQGFTSISQRLPFEVRALAYGDADGDGQEEVLLTSQAELYVYRLQGDGQLVELARHVGKKLDHFVKVGIFPRPGGSPLIVLTNLRGDQARSQLLTLKGSQIHVEAEDIPFQLRAAKQGSRVFLLGETYHARPPSKHRIYEMVLEGKSLKPVSKMELPGEADLYSFEWLPSATDPAGWDLVALTPSGTLKLFRQEKGKYKRVWSSRESYGGSANDVPIEVRDFFNEVVADYYVVPLGVDALIRDSKPEIVLAKNDMLLKGIVGRKPIATDGKMVRLSWNQLGFSETWVSEKVDGSILDYLVTPAFATDESAFAEATADKPVSAPVSKRGVSDLPDAESAKTEVPAPGGRQLLVAVRVRDRGFWEGAGKKDSVLLVYDLK
jgi:hypothetical protein